MKSIKISENIYFRVLLYLIGVFPVAAICLSFMSWPAVFLLCSISVPTLMAYSLHTQVAKPLRILARQGRQLLAGDRKYIDAPVTLPELRSVKEVFDETAGMMEAIMNATGAVAGGDLSRRLSADFVNSHLALSVNAMIEKLQETGEQESIRAKYTAGLAFFAGILRAEDENLEQLAVRAVSELVKFLEINQGGLFLTETTDEGQPVLRLHGCYAYGRKKYLNKEIMVGEGLVGQCYLEREPVYLTEIPPEYAIITSGLGEAGPTALLLCPLIYNDIVYGVLELAGFKNFEIHEQEFLNKLCENMAAAVHNLRSNLHTRQLLQESLARQEQMQAQEEEMRQNMEEMMALQEEMQRRNETLRLTKISALQQAARQAAIRLKADVDTALDAARTLAQVFTVFKTQSENFKSPRHQANAMLQSVLLNNPAFLATYTLWEPGAFDGKDQDHMNLPGHDATGRYIPYHTWHGGDFHLEPLVNYTITGDGDYYLIPKNTLSEAVINPYIYPVRGVDTWIMSAVAPVMLLNEFLGICGVDFSIEAMQGIIDGVTLPVKNASLTVLAHNGTVVKSTLPHLTTGMPATKAVPAQLLPSAFDKAHSREKAGIFYWFQPLRFGKIATPWGVCLACPTDELYKERG